MSMLGGNDLHQSKRRRVCGGRRKSVADSRWVRRMARGASLVRKKRPLPMGSWTEERFSELQL
ncbi:hypothetical protein CsSME_00038791 [Camellia sinensis var. sinensis]